MKVIIGVILGVVLLAVVATFSLYGRTIMGSVSDSVRENTPAEFDVRLAKTAINDLKEELIRDNRNLLSLRRDIERTERDISNLTEQIDRLASQIQAGANLLTSNNESITVNNASYSRAQIESQVESYISSRSNKRQMLRRREEHVISLRQKLAEMESAVANKRLKVEEYESQIAMLEIDVRFKSNADRYNVSTSNTEVQSIIDRLSDKVHVSKIIENDVGAIDFVNEESNLKDKISEELGN